MTHLPFAGSSTITRLHRTVQRNISRAHQQTRRHDSTKQSPSQSSTSSSSNAAPPPPPPPNQHRTTIPGPSWAWIDPLLRPPTRVFQAYSSMQARSPLLTQLEASLIIYYLGDLSAQMVSTNVFIDGHYEPGRALRALLIGGLSSIPSYKWFLFLGRNFNYANHWVGIAVKIVVNQTFFTPVFNSYFFGMQSLLSGASWAETKRRVRETVPVSWKNSWKVWPAVTAFSFTFIRPVNRSVFAGVVAIFWQTYLSWLNKNAEGRAQIVGEKEMEREKGAVKRVGKKTAEKDGKVLKQG